MAGDGGDAGLATLTPRTFTVPGPPVGKQRPRFADGHVHTQAPTRLYEATVQLAALAAGIRMEPGTFEVTIVWARQVTASWSKRKRAAALAQVYAPGMPDLDNVAKALLDALNGIAYADDRQVAKLTISRIYVESESSVRVEITTIGGEQ